MKIQKTLLSLTAVFGILLFISTAAWATASPVVFYSDLTSGPNTGGQNSNGVFVTIWGNNFGSTQGSSTVTVGGGAVANYQTWTNTEICFQLGSSAATGNIVVTTSNGTSNGMPFTVRSGNIYFVQPGASTNGTGTYASPFSHLWYAYNIQKAGDTVYVLAGTIHDEENGYTGWHSIITTQNAGTKADPIAYVAYPNATVILQADGGTSTWTAGSSGGNDPVEYIFRDDGGAWTTISKFTMELTGTGANTEVDAGTDTGWRVVGNTFTANSYIYAQIDFAGPNAEVIGNTIYNSGAGMGQGNENHSIYLDGASNPFEIGWNYLYGNENSGWEISCFHQGQRNGSIHDNLIIAKSAGSVKGILLGDVDTGETQSTEWASTYKVYNNVIVNAGQASYGGAMQLVDGTGYIYNNTIYYSGTETKGVIQVPTSGVGPNGGNPVWYFADNIIVANNAGLYISDENGNAPNWSFFALLADNNYYGEGNGPTNDTTAINANPQFITPGTTTSTNFQLQAASPDIDAGYNTTAITPEDYYGLLRSSTPSIGAYQYSSGITPSSPVVSITSPSSGSAYTTGSNVTITTTASENNGTIRNISLYNGSGILLGSSSSSPYSYVYSDILAGGYSFYAVATDANGVSTTSSTITVTVTTPSVAPSITTQPVNVTVTAPATATFTVAATGTPAPTYQWMQSINNGAYTNISGATGASYTTAATTTANSGTKFECVVMNTAGSVTSNAATLTVNPAPVAPAITTQPASVTVTAPATASFTIAATGTPAPTYQWMQSVNSGAYTAISGATSASYITAATTTANSGTKFECVITNGSGSVTSNAATLTVNPAPVAPAITAQPVSVTVIAPAPATFTVAATGTPAPNYQWMQSVNSGAYTAISGATSASYTTAATTTANSGTKFECVITNGSGSVTSNAATLTVNPQPSLPIVSLVAPINNIVFTAPVSFTLTANASEPNGTISQVQFYNGSTLLYTANGGGSQSYTWFNVPAGVYSFTAKAIDANGVVATSSSVTVTVNSPASQPSVPTVSLVSPLNDIAFTGPVSFTLSALAAETNGTISQVQFYNGSTLLYTANGGGSQSYTLLNMPAGVYNFTAKAIDANGAVATSSSVTVTVNSPASQPSVPTVSMVSPLNDIAFTGPVSFTLSALAAETNGTISQVQFYNGSTLLYTANGGGLQSYTWFNVPVGVYNFTAKAIDANGVVATSSSITVTVNSPVSSSLPSVNLVTPFNNIVFAGGPLSVTLTAIASETNGTISQVQFYNGSTLLYTANGGGLQSYTWNDIPPGTYTLTAKAIDSNGAVATSTTVNMTITS